MTAIVSLSSPCQATVALPAVDPFDLAVCPMSPVGPRPAPRGPLPQPKSDAASEQCRPSHPALAELALRFDAERAILWQFMQPKARPSFTEGLLADMNAALDWVAEVCRGRTGEAMPVRYLVLASRLPGTFNLGGDLALFLRAIEARDEARLHRYARACINVQYRRASNLSLPLGTIALVAGDALGGGFEAALAHEVIIAERRARFGLPEVLFNLFPGMGALSFLARRLPPAQAERIVLSGRVYTAEEMAALGIVDRVVDDGTGEAAVLEFIREAERSWRTRTAVAAARRIVSPVTEDELLRVVDLWVATALTLSPADLRKMKHLIGAQDRRRAREASH